jgi:CRP-like cAMP-binding protein
LASIFRVCWNARVAQTGISGQMYSGANIKTPDLWTDAGPEHLLLTPKERDLVAVISTVVRFKKREMIYREGDNANAVYSIATGVVKSYRKLSADTHHIVGFLFANDLMGLAENGKCVNSAEAVTRVTAYRIPISALQTRLLEYAHLDFVVIAKLCHDLREAQRHAFLLSRRYAAQKISLFLQMLDAQQTFQGGGGMDEVYLPMSRVDIAAYLGITAEEWQAVSRAS